MGAGFIGVVIEESLEDKNVLNEVTILSTKIEKVTERHKTPWIKQWTVHRVEIPMGKEREIAKSLSESLDSQHAWYADFKNDMHHFIIFRNKIFSVDRANRTQYDEAKKYGLSLGIPEYQVDFHPTVAVWKRDK